MNKKLLIIILLAGLIVATIIGCWLFWLSKSKKPLNIYVLDKTVPTMERSEHKSFNWILNYNKYVKPDGNLYDTKSDYYGFFPLNTKSQEFDFRSIRIHEIEDAAESYDMLYYADTYGVYYNEWYKKGSTDVKHTQKVYGGLNQNDYLLMKQMKNNKKLVIAEFNLYNAPTNGLIREKVEQLFDLSWTGWTGKYFSSLDTAVGSRFPAWIVNLYMEQNNNEWPFKNAGIVLVHKFGTIAVLEQETHLTKEIPCIVATAEAVDRFDIPARVHYPQWFDITFSGNKNKVIASFNIQVNSKGDSILRSYNLKPIFPAVIEHLNDYKFYYFGGDFAENDVNSKTAYFDGYKNFASVLTKLKYSSSRKFYWTFYVPMVTRILDDYYGDITEKAKSNNN